MVVVSRILRVVELVLVRVLSIWRMVNEVIRSRAFFFVRVSHTQTHSTFSFLTFPHPKVRVADRILAR